MTWQMFPFYVSFCRLYYTEEIFGMSSRLSEAERETHGWIECEQNGCPASFRHMVYKGVLCEKVCEKSIIHPGIGGEIRGKKVWGEGKETAACA